MKKTIRDLAATLAALSALFLVLISINPAVRDRAGEMTGGLTTQQWDASSSAVGHAVGSVLAVSTSYANNNVYLFVFMVVACVLFVMMLRT